MLYVHARPNATVFLYPVAVVERNPIVVCSPDFSYRFGVADQAGQVAGSAMTTSYVIVVRHDRAVYTKEHTVRGSEAVDTRDARMELC